MEGTWYQNHGGEAGVLHLFGQLVTTTGGAIDTDASSFKRFSVVKTDGEVGRYTITLAGTVNTLLSVTATVAGAADAAYSGGSIAIIRNNTVSTDGTFDLQLLNASSADAEVADGAAIHIAITVKNSSAY